MIQPLPRHKEKKSRETEQNNTRKRNMNRGYSLRPCELAKGVLLKREKLGRPEGARENTLKT